jgi:uncharacterized phage protein gp47/JayE
MYESITEDVILDRILSRIPDTLDRRPGSVIFDAVAPAARELAILYSCLGDIIEDVFADTADREFLIRRAAERDIIPYPATHAVWRGEFSLDVPVGSRYSIDDLDYIVTGRIDQGVFEVKCETAGAAGNTLSGDMIPVEYIDGLEYARLVSLIAPGEDEEDTEHLRERYYQSVEVEAFGGNKVAYREAIGTLPGVGGVKVYRAPDGGGTVGVTITDALHRPPAPQLVESVQEAIDPMLDGGGDGLAPIGHVVTVSGAVAVPITITATLDYDVGYGWVAVAEDVYAALDAYYARLSAAWPDLEAITVRVSHIESAMLSVTGVADITDTTVNGSAVNLILGADDVPVRGAFNGE